MAAFPSFPQSNVDAIIAGTSTKPLAEEPAPEPVAEPEAPAAASLPTSRDCGTGSGGFKPGNKCAPGGGGGGSAESLGSESGDLSSQDLQRVFRGASQEALNLSTGSNPEQVKERAEIKKQVAASVLQKLDRMGMDEDSVPDSLLSATGFDHEKYREGAPEGYEKRHALVRGVIDQWANTSGDSDPRAVGIQKAIAEEFGGDIPGVSAASMDHLGKYDSLYAAVDASRFKGVEEVVAKSSAVRDVLRAQYNATQDYFEEQGIKELTLHRGFISDRGAVKSSESESFSLQPASSFSTSRKTAEMFADDLSSQIGGLVTVRVPVSRVLCTAVTGMGCVTEQEVVVLGGSIQGKVTAGGKKK
jgi:hypothetical protein